MTYETVQYPGGIYPGEIEEECPEAREAIDVLLREMARQGPDPLGYDAKNLGKKKKGLWQINLKIEKLQSRILYAPYGPKIVLFRIHRKGSPQEQERAYRLAMDRKRDYDAKIKGAKREKGNGRDRTSN